MKIEKSPEKIIIPLNFIGALTKAAQMFDKGEILKTHLSIPEDDRLPIKVWFETKDELYQVNIQEINLSKS